MFSKQTYRAISFGLVGCMVDVAWSEFQRGAQVADIHLITTVQLTLASTSIVSTGVAVHENAIIEARYFEPPNTKPLPLNDVTHPVSFLRR